MRLRRILKQNPASRTTVLIGLGLLGAGAYFLTRKAKRPPAAEPEEEVLVPVPGGLEVEELDQDEDEHEHEAEPAPEEPPPVVKAVQNIPGVGGATIYPAGAEDFPIPAGPTDVAYSEDCTAITVPVAWWDTTAIAIFNSMWQDDQHDPEVIADMIAKTEIGHCADFDTPAVSQFLAALDTWVNERRAELVQPTQLQQ